MFSQTAEYALRAVTFLAQQDSDAAIGNETIAAGTKVPVSYLAKTLKQLAAAEILSSRRGVGGGFRLARSPEELTVYEVIAAVDPIKRITTCPLGLKSHRDQLCPLHNKLDSAMEHVEDVLRQSTIAEVIADPGRPTPLVECETSYANAAAR